MNPFSEKDPLSSLGEKALIARICADFGASAPKAPFGPGDDCALIRAEELGGGDMLATSDAVILGRHFDASTDPRLAGRKLVNRNASDIAAMGGRPAFALASGIVSAELSLGWLDGFCAGASEAAEKLGVKIVGGDVASVGGRFFSMHMSLLGTAPERTLLRSGARIGDALYVTGGLGLSFESGRHLDFEPRIAEGEFLAQTWGVGACIDLSDGLASDVKNIIPRGACAEVFEDSVPRRSFGGKTATLREALCGGEDYELLFAYRGDCGEFERAWAESLETPLSRIGRISAPASASEAGGLVVVRSGGGREIFRGSGFDHMA